MMNKVEQKIYKFLRWSQRYTQTDMIYLAKGGFWLTLGHLTSTVTSFLSAIIFANFLDPITYGNYKYVLSLVGILSIFTLTGMATAIVQAVAGGFEGSFYTGFKAKLKWALLGSLVAVGLAGYYLLRENYTLSLPLLISAIFLPLMQASRIYTAFLAGKKLFNIQVKYKVLNQAVPVLSLILTLFLTKNIFWLIAVYFVSNTFLNYFFYLLTQRKFRPNKKEDPKTISYGKHLSIIDVLNVFANYLDHLFIFHFLGAAQLAIYSFASSPPEQIKGFLQNIQILALPKFAEKSKEEIKSTFLKKLFKFLILTTITAGLYILFAPLMYKLFFPQYLESIRYSQVLAISLIIAGGLSTSALESQMATKEKYIMSIFSGISKILLMGLLVLFYGIWGIIAGIVLTRFFTFFISLELIKKLR